MLGARLGFLASIVTLNGLFLALAWGAFAKIYEAAGTPGFARWLRKKNILNSYYFHVDYIHTVQILALVTGATTLILNIYGAANGVPFWLHRLGTAATIGTFFYALLYASSAVKMMQDLVWYRAVFEEEQLNQSDQVIPLQKGKG